MDFRKLPDADLVDFAQNVVAKVPDMVGTAIPAPLVAAASTESGSLSDAIQASLAGFTTSTALTALKNQDRADLIDKLSQIKATLRANLNPDSDFELLGFGKLDREPSLINAQSPTNLVATGDSTNRNYLRWKGNNRSGSVNYIIEYTAGDTMQWTFLAATKSQKFTHDGVTPGQVYQYRVKAQSAKTESAYSNTAVVYGS